jgi:hypothetical protein
MEQGEGIAYSAEHVDFDEPSNMDEIDNYNESSQGYDTSYTSVASKEYFSDSDDSIIPYQNPVTYLSGIGHVRNKSLCPHPELSRSMVEGISQLLTRCRLPLRKTLLTH